MPWWHALLSLSLLSLSLLAANGDSSNNASTKIGGEDSKGTKDVFEDGPDLDYLR